MRSPELRKVITLSDKSDSVQLFSKQIHQCSYISIQFSLGRAKLNLTLTDCENITNQFATKREVIYHQKEANVFKKLFTAAPVVTLLENCV